MEKSGLTDIFQLHEHQTVVKFSGDFGVSFHQILHEPNKVCVQLFIFNLENYHQDQFFLLCLRGLLCSDSVSKSI